MGILDDAIREHLELKRKHGAAEDELERQEEEALGPARREVAPTQAQDENGAGEPAAAEPSADGEPPLDAQVDAPSAEAPEAEAVEPPTEGMLEPEPDPESRPGPETQPELESAPQLASEPKPEPEVLEPEPQLASEPEPEPEEPEPEPEPQPDRSAVTQAGEPAGHQDPPAHPDPSPQAGDTPPRGFEALGEDADEPLVDADKPEGEDGEEGEEGEAGDVLDDTPDFLQETPEHDRLWFEQKPPRDFDFD